jgi:hypothetical protein
MAGQPGRSGGRRQGVPGRKYPNRRDLRTKQAPKAVTGQAYGDRKAQLDAQKVIPLSNQPAPPQGTSAPQGMAAMAGQVGGGAVGPIPSLSAPSARPDEPITAGLPSGPGPGPEALNIPPTPGADDQMLGVLRGLYQAYPNSHLARLISELQTAQTIRAKPPGFGA